MIEALIRFIFRKLGLLLITWGDARAKEEIAEHDRRVAENEQRAKEAIAKRQESERIYAEENAKRIEWDRLAAEVEQQAIESQARFVANQTRVREIEAELAKTQEFIERQSDADKVRLDL